MPHKFKIGAVVNYRPADRLVSAPRGTYIITGHKPALDGQAPEYRIRHPSEEFERIAVEGELSASEPEHGQR
jgi:hypothetical protein